MSPLWLGWTARQLERRPPCQARRPRDSIVLELEPRLPDGGLGSLSGGIPERSPGLRQGWS